MVNKTLKIRARAFMENHDVPYLTALKAVDEPLFSLRNYEELASHDWSPYRGSFRLAGDAGPFSKEDILHLAKNQEEAKLEVDIERDAIKALGSIPHLELYKMFGERLKKIEDAGVESIWQYRELFRAGLLTDNEIMEPIFHHYRLALIEWGNLLRYTTPRVGIFSVNCSSFEELEDSFASTPITLAQLEEFKTGKPLTGVIYAPLSHGKYGPDRHAFWEDSYEEVYRFQGEPSSWGNGLYYPQLIILVKNQRDDLKEVLESYGIDTNFVKPSDIIPTGVEIPHHLEWTHMHLDFNGDRKYFSTYELLIIE